MQIRTCTLAAVLLVAGAAAKRAPPTAAELATMAARFAPVAIDVSLAALPQGERRALAHE